MTPRRPQPPTLTLLAYAALLLASGCGETPFAQDTSRLGDTFDRDGPYTVRTVVAHPEHVDSVVLVVQLGEGATTTQRIGMGEIRRGIFQGRITGQPAFTRVQYHVEVSGGDEVTTDPPGAAQGQSFFGFWVLGDRCQVAADCLPGEFCDSARVCRARGGPCAKDVDCGKAFRCVEGRCRLQARACSSDAGCLLGEVCDILLGECTPRPTCEPDAASGTPTPCPLDFVCEADVCKRQCAGDGDCLPGERCDIKRICRVVPPSCAGPQDCGSGLVCDPILGLCRAQGAGPCGGCATDLDCGGAGDHCLVIGGALRCGKDCSISGCPPAFTCDTGRALPQCVPTDGACP